MGVVFFSTTERMMIRTSLLILLGSLSSVIGEDYIINQERPDWAAVKDGTKEYPWIVQIVRIKNANSNTKYKWPLCTGTLISQDRIATAKHCLDKYPNDLRNTTTIEVEKGMIVALKFTAFNVEWGDDSCPYDHLTIEDGDGSTLLETCGNRLPEDLVSKSNVVKLNFTTDESVAESGWSVTWSAEKPTGI